MKKAKNHTKYYQETETYGINNIKQNIKELKKYTPLCLSYFLSDIKNGMAKIDFYFPDVLIEKTKTKENIYDFRLKKTKLKTTITKKYYFPVKTKKEFLTSLKQLSQNNYIIKGNYSLNNIEKQSISSYNPIIDNEKHHHNINLTIYTKEKFKECFIKELKELLNTYKQTKISIEENTLKISEDIDELFNNELSRIIDYYYEVENQEEILKELNILPKKPKTYTKKIEKTKK